MQKTTSISPGRQLMNFLLHLRWHYQVGILSGGFLLGGVLSSTMNWPDFLLQFANVHLLLFGGATAYNSYWDKDEGPVGGLRHPPKMAGWMWSVSLIMQFFGLIVALFQGIVFALIYAGSMLFFWLYSTPLARWKGRPVKSLFAIGISTGTNSLFLGYLAAGGTLFSISVWSAGVGVALILLSLYPVSQVFQVEEDRRRGDQTFTMTYGFRGVLHFFEASYTTGLVMISIALVSYSWSVSLFFGALGALTGLWIHRMIRTLKSLQSDYHLVMRIKMATSCSFVFFLLWMLLIRHVDYGIFSSLDVLLR